MPEASRRGDDAGVRHGFERGPALEEVSDTKRILIATDGSAASRQALQEGLELALATGAAVTLVTVRSPAAAVLGKPGDEKELSDPAQARATMGEAAGAAREAGLQPEQEILEGDPAEALLECARVKDADLVVIGSRGRGAVVSALLGSVSREVVNRADRPVLVVKPLSPVVLPRG